MNTNQILQSSMLDILFENRNKQYGAYILRKEYDKRLVKALAITTLLVGLICAYQIFKGSTKSTNSNFVGETSISAVVIPKDEIKKPIEKVKPKQTVVASKKFTTPLIVRQTPENITKVAELENNAISTKSTLGPQTTQPFVPEPTPEPGPVTTQPAITEPEPILQKGPFDISDLSVLPLFPGGQAALSRFLGRTLTEQDNLEPGSKVIVRVMFIINEEGQINEAQIINSGGTNFDLDVLKAVNRMPKWKPGEQNGIKVSVRFVLPITFESHE